MVFQNQENVLLKLIKNYYQWPDIDKTYLYVKDPFESKYQLLINGRKKIGIENSKNLKAFADYSQKIHDVYENFEDYNLTKKRSANSVWWYDSRYGI